MKIGLIREEKIPADARVVLTPKQCSFLVGLYPEFVIKVQSSDVRIFKDDEYRAEGIEVTEDVSDCDYLFGVKEVPDASLIPNKTYFFFSHTKKKQPYNQHLMQTLLAKKIKMIDYESLVYENGQRIIGFGFYAGIVGAHNALLTYGKKHGLFTLKPAHQCHDLKEMYEQYITIHLPNIKVVVTGDGRVAHGIIAVLKELDFQSVPAQDINQIHYSNPVYTQLRNENLYQHQVTHTYFRDDFHKNPEAYESQFHNYYNVDILMNGIYWDINIPPLFELKDIKDPKFTINVIADVTCDVDGSIPLTVKTTKIADPVFGYDKNSNQVVAPFMNDNNIIDIMAVDNLPSELPRDASEHFGNHIIRHILPEILKKQSDILDRATICENGKLTSNFEYLSDYAYGEILN